MLLALCWPCAAGIEGQLEKGWRHRKAWTYFLLKAHRVHLAILENNVILERYAVFAPEMSTPRLIPADPKYVTFGGLNPRYLTAANQALYFVGSNIYPLVQGRRVLDRNFYLWKVSNKGNRAQPVALGKYTFARGASSAGTDIAAVGKALYFTGNSPSDLLGLRSSSRLGLWKTNGTAKGTDLVRGFEPKGTNDQPRDFTPVGKTLFFTVNDGSGSRLWRSSGTRRSTILLSRNALSPSSFTAVGRTLFFTADDGKSGNELWKSNGTRKGTRLVADILPGGASSNPRDLTQVGRSLFFAATDRTGRLSVWKSDGTSRGTVRVGGENPRNLTAAGRNLFFRDVSFVQNPGAIPGLWVSNGTARGTIPLARDVPDRLSSIGRTFREPSAPDQLTAARNTLFFTAGRQRVEGRRLWKSDGTAAGTVPIAARMPVMGRNARPTIRLAVGNNIYFTDSAEQSQGLWKTDGTAKGTARIASLGTSTASQFTRVGRSIYYTSSGELLRINLNQSSPSRATLTKANTTASSGGDLLTGQPNSRDRFTWNSLSDSLLARYDTITNFETVDRLRVQGSRFRSTLTSSEGRIRNLNAKQIGNLLTRRSFSSSEAAAFQVRGMRGTFIALNDSRAGFQANRDAVIFLEGFNINQSSNSVTII